jgi:hypothetical protein
MVILIGFSVFRSLINPKDKKTFCLGLYTLSCFVLVVWHRYYYDRYFFPLFASCYVLLGIFLNNLIEKKYLSTKFVIGIFVLSTIYNIWLCTKQDLGLLKQSPRTQAYYWVQNNIKNGSSILTNLHNLHLPETPSCIENRLKLAQRHKTYKLTYYKLQHQASLRSKIPRYNIKFVYDFSTVGIIAPQKDEFVATEDAFSHKEIEKNPDLLKQYEYFITDGAVNFNITGDRYFTLLKEFGEIHVYSIRQ